MLWARAARTGQKPRNRRLPLRRDRLHGGKSTGPRTPEGLERCRTANWKHGMYSKEGLAERQRVRGLWREVDASYVSCGRRPTSPELG